MTGTADMAQRIHTTMGTIPEICRQLPTGGVTGVVLAGGGSRRMGRNKALLPLSNDRTMLAAVLDVMAPLFDEVLLVTGGQELCHDDIRCRKICDLFPGKGPLAGIHAALTEAGHERIFVAGCDMPFLNPGLIAALCHKGGGDVASVVPEGANGLEPLHAVYHRDTLAEAARMLQGSERGVRTFIGRINPLVVARHEVRLIDPDLRSFRNINTPEEYSRCCCRSAAAG
jgi:molybdopterin-guanine dinucleotide biosynthesis protein A